jgi:hypothetical protein
MKKLNNAVDALMACKTEEERQAILDAEEKRMSNMTDEQAFQEAKETAEMLKYVSDKIEWMIRLKNMKKHYGWTDENIATLAGYASANSFRNSLRKTFPGLLKLAIQVFEKEQTITT